MIRAWKQVGKGRLVLVGSGPEREGLEGSGAEVFDSLPQEKLFELIRSSAICIAPALSEFNPNFILEALSLGKPVLISRGHGLSVDLPEEFLFDPEDEEELREKIAAMLEPGRYKKAVEVVAALPMSQSWEDVTTAHLKLIRELL